MSSCITPTSLSDLVSRIEAFGGTRDRYRSLFQGLKAVETFLETGPIHVDLFRAPMPNDRVVFRSRAQDVYNINIFHSDAYVRREWGLILEVRDILPGAHGYQDLVLMINGK